MTDNKTCTSCHQAKPKTDFDKNKCFKDGLKATCRQCCELNTRKCSVCRCNKKVEQFDQSALDDSEKLVCATCQEKRKSASANAQKTCNKCKTLKSLSEFPKDASHSSGYKARCQTCVAGDRKAYVAQRQTIPKREPPKIDQKTCTDCKTLKPIQDFDPDKSYTSGRKAYCKTCRKARSAEQHAKNKAANLAGRSPAAEKKCSTCKQNRSAEDFPKNISSNDGLFHCCKSCTAIAAKTIRDKSPERLREYSRKSANIIKAKHEQGLLPRPAEKQCCECKETYAATNFFIDNCKKDGLSCYCKACEITLHSARNCARRKTDPEYKLISALRSSIRSRLIQKAATKCDRTVALLGCSVTHFRHYLEVQFKPGMTWENHGNKCDGKPYWEIDHCLAINMFCIRDPEEQRRCFHYSNHQPLWGPENRFKSDKVALNDDVLSGLYRLFDPHLNMW